jgi:hypothetical protein
MQRQKRTQSFFEPSEHLFREKASGTCVDHKDESKDRVWGSKRLVPCPSYNLSLNTVCPVSLQTTASHSTDDFIGRGPAWALGFQSVPERGLGGWLCPVRAALRSRNIFRYNFIKNIWKRKKNCFYLHAKIFNRKKVNLCLAKYLISFKYVSAQLSAWRMSCVDRSSRSLPSKLLRLTEYHTLSHGGEHHPILSTRNTIIGTTLWLKTQLRCLTFIYF